MFKAYNWPATAMMFFATAFCLCGGCATGPNPADPYEKYNRSIYNFNEGLDRVALKPVSDAYIRIIPQPIRTGLGNGFDNLVYFNVVANDVFQGQWDQGLGDFGRMAVNSTIGIAGIFDVATGWRLPAHDNDFGLTLRKWGAKPGPFLELPLFGPSTLTDVAALPVKYVCDPLTWLWLPYKISIPVYSVDTVDARSRIDNLVRFRNESAVDPYVFTREAYLQYRQNRAETGKPAPPTTAPSIYDENDDTTAPATQPMTQPAR